MRPTDRPVDFEEYRTPGTLAETFAASAVFLGLVWLSLLAASAPVPVLGALAIAATPLLLRRVARRLDIRRREGRARRVCFPVVHVCVSA